VNGGSAGSTAASNGSNTSPQWSPPVNDGSTRPDGASGPIPQRAAMEPTGERRDGDHSGRGVRPGKNAAMEPPVNGGRIKGAWCDAVGLWEPQWSPPVNGRSILARVRVLGLAAVAAMEPPVNGGTTSARAHRCESRAHAAMEPAAERRDDRVARREQDRDRQAAMDPADGRREDSPSSRCRTPKTRCRNGARRRTAGAPGKQNAPILWFEKPQWSPPVEGGSAARYLGAI
jgi:hypothetical protein